MKTILYGLQYWDLNDIARISDLSVEELSCLTYGELWDIVDDWHFFND